MLFLVLDVFLVVRDFPGLILFPVLVPLVLVRFGSAGSGSKTVQFLVPGSFRKFPA